MSYRDYTSLAAAPQPRTPMLSEPINNGSNTEPIAASRSYDGPPAIMPMWIMGMIAEGILDPADSSLYTVFLWHRNGATGTAWMSRDTMLRFSCCPVNQLTKRLEKLCRIGLIQKCKRRGQNGSFEYFVPLGSPTLGLTERDPEKASDSRSVIPTNSRTHGACVLGLTERDRNSVLIEHSLSTEKEKSSTGETESKSMVDEEGFETFWEASPHQTGKAKARAAFSKAAKTTDTETILRGTARYLANEQAKQRQYGDGFRKLSPAAWLENEGWADAPSGIPKPSDGILRAAWSAAGFNSTGNPGWEALTKDKATLNAMCAAYAPLRYLVEGIRECVTILHPSASLNA